MNFPDDLKYTKDHEWLRIEGNVGYVGITDFAQNELGDIVYLDITEDGAVAAGASFGSVEAVKTVSELYMPIEATILEVNGALQSNPELLNSDPYGEGWILTIEITGALDGLLDASAYKSLIGQ